MDLILAEQLLLLLLDDDKGSDSSTYGGDPGLAGALLLDLTHARALTEGDGKLAAAGTPPEHPVLAEAHAVIASGKERDAKGWVKQLPKEIAPLRERLAERLVDGGVLSEERRKVLGLFGSARFPEADPEPERALRARLQSILLRESTPAPREAMLVALLEPYDLVRKLVPKDRRKDAKQTAKEFADGGAAAKAVGDALGEIQGAIIASTVAATTAVTLSTTSVTTT